MALSTRVGAARLCTVEEMLRTCLRGGRGLLTAHVRLGQVVRYMVATLASSFFLSYYLSLSARGFKIP